ncbi:MAG: Fic family protein, partial [Gammaproteobacteria bacterium]|nr:Fic family protein [Gammaproteobacteria bacterium]
MRRSDRQPWLLYFLRALQRQKRNLAEKVERERAAVALSSLAADILGY